jgi:hypothetical protein
MKVRIYIKNALTKEIVTDHVITVEDYDKELMWTNMQLNHKALSESFPDCHVNFEFLDNQDFIAGVPHNMELDQAKIDTGEMSWQSYMKKWHNMDVEYSALPSLN